MSENGGNTIIEFPICDRNFNWLNYKHIEKGGKTTNQDNNYMNQNQYKYNLKIIQITKALYILSLITIIHVLEEQVVL